MWGRQVKPHTDEVMVAFWLRKITSQKRQHSDCFCIFAFATLLCLFMCYLCTLCVYMLRALCVIHLLWTSKCAHMLAYTYLCLVEGLLYASAFMSALWVLLLLAIWSSVSTSSTKLLAVNMAEMSLSFQRSSLHREHSYGRRFFPSSLEAHKLMQRTTIEEYKRIWT